MEVRDHHIVVEVVTVHPHEIHEADVVVSVAMDDYGCALSRFGLACGGENGMEPIAILPGQGRVPEHPAVVKGAVPIGYAGVA